MRVLLNDTAIDEPLNWENLRLRKVRDPSWGGIVENTGGQVEEDGLLFRDPLAVEMIRSAWETKQHQAELYLRVESDGYTWQSSLDWDTLQVRDEGVSIGLTDRSARKVLTAAQTVSEWEATDTYTLAGVPLGGNITATVPADKAVVSGHSPSHAVPVKGSKEGIGEYLDGSLPFWRNDTGYAMTIRLEMLLVVAVVIRAEVPYSVFVRIYDASDQVVDTQLVGTYTEGQADWLYSADLSIERDYGVGVWVSCQSEVYTFTYSAEGGISLLEVPDETSEVASIRLDRLLARWAAANGLGVQGSGLLEGYYLTSGALLRGADRPMKVELDRLLADLRKLLNLKTGHHDSVMQLKKGVTRGGLYIEQVEKIALDPLVMMHSSVVYGFRAWKSETVRGSQEPNGRLTYATRFETKGELDLSLDYLVGGTYLIEKLRRMRGGQTGQAQDADYDDTLFLLSDLDLMAVQQDSWKNDLYYNYPLRLVSADGRARADTLTASVPNYQPYTANIEVSLPLSEYSAIGDTVQCQYNGATYHIEVDEATHSIQDGTTVITGKILS
ncbi:hypothetical protein [Salmonirosea aquatica]|uniref:Uncharacterized protein n=1 Tax=Salmonirosea aquatica TaxID=2654236 RepID=A0A7C9FZZ9_9BACT|nr:hypothetical protein [Cytophagaceae bacterium SJW1-29]